MADENKYYNDFESILSDDSMELIYKSIIRNMHSFQIKKFIVKKLFYFYVFNKM